MNETDQLDFAAAIIDYCTHTHASVTSWGRTIAHNTAVGGVAHSRHLTWTAVDVIYDSPILITERKTIAASLGLWLIDERDHDHLQSLRS